MPFRRLIALPHFWQLGGSASFGFGGFAFRDIAALTLRRERRVSQPSAAERVQCR